MSKITRLDWSKTAKQFPVNSRGKFLCQYHSGEQASQHMASSFPFSDFYIFSSLLGCYFSGTSCTFHFGQRFRGWNVLEADRRLHSWLHIDWRNTQIWIHRASRMEQKCGKCWKLPIFEGKLRVFFSYLSEMKIVSSTTLPYSSTFYSLFLPFFILEIFKFKYGKFFVRYSGSISKFERFEQPCFIGNQQVRS